MAEITDELRERILKKLEDLKSKIKNNEELPHGEQDYDVLLGIDENLDSCLNNWYY